MQLNLRLQQSASLTTRPIFRKKSLLLAGVILLLNIVLYHKSLGYFFVMDDFYFMNRARGEAIRELFTDTVQFRPIHFRQIHHLTFLSCLRLMRLFFGLDPYYYHLTNLSIFVVDCLLIFLFFLKITGDDIVAFLTALIFLTRASSFLLIYWLSGLPDLLSILFSMISLLLYVYHLERGGRTFLILSFLTFLFGASIKEFGVMTPALMALYSVIIRRERSLSALAKRLLPFGIAVGFLAFFAVMPSKPGLASEIYAFSFHPADLLYAFRTYLSYSLNITYIFYVFESNYTSLVEGAVFTLVLLVGFFTRDRLRPALRDMLFGVSWYVAGLLPVIFLSRHVSHALAAYAVPGLSYAIASAIKVEGRKVALPLFVVWVVSFSCFCTHTLERGEGPGLLMKGSFITRNLVNDATRILSQMASVEKITLLNETAFTNDLFESWLHPRDSFELFTGRKRDVVIIKEGTAPTPSGQALVLVITNGPNGPRILAPRQPRPSQ